VKKIHLEQIKEEAISAYPAECCGLLIGEKNGNMHTLKRIVPSINPLRDLDNNQFEIDPQTRIDVERELRHTTEHLIGHFHSHPDRPATPSKTDLNMAYEPELIWLIITVLNGKAEDMNAYQLNAYTQETLQIKCQIVA
jgi:proteasome lid subunit RPN8/RPN11